MGGEDKLTTNVIANQKRELRKARVFGLESQPFEQLTAVERIRSHRGGPIPLGPPCARHPSHKIAWDGAGHHPTFTWER